MTTKEIEFKVAMYKDGKLYGYLSTHKTLADAEIAKDAQEMYKNDRKFQVVEITTSKRVVIESIKGGD